MDPPVNYNGEQRNAFLNVLREAFFRYAKNIPLLDFEKQGTILSGSYAILILLFVMVSISPHAMIPLHNVLENPEYWAEIMVTIPMLSIVYPLLIHFEYVLVMRNDYNSSTIKLFYLYIGVTLSLSTIFVVLCIIWIYALNYRPPVPFNTTFVFLLAFAILYTVLWFLQPLSCLLYTSDAADE